MLELNGTEPERNRNKNFIISCLILRRVLLLSSFDDFDSNFFDRGIDSALDLIPYNSGFCQRFFAIFRHQNLIFSHVRKIVRLWQFFEKLGNNNAKKLNTRHIMIKIVI